MPTTGRRILLRGLEPNASYTIRQAGRPDAPGTRATGAELMADGYDVHLPGGRYAATLFVIRPAG